jgi:hypothetical protein
MRLPGLISAMIAGTLIELLQFRVLLASPLVILVRAGYG